MSRKNKTLLYSLTAMGIILLLVLVLAVVRSLSAQSGETETTEASETVPRNEYRAEAFYYDDGLLRYEDGAHMVGIDVSVHQGVIDWQRVAQAGVEFAIIRAGYRGSTVGDLYEDEQFRYNLQEAQNAGVQVGIYFFSQALTPEEAVEEAKYACALLDGASLDLPIYFDWEYIGGRVENVYELALTDCAIAFCEEVEANGYKAGVYFNQEFGYLHFSLGRLQEYHLWLAEYGDHPEFYYHFDCLQYTASGAVDGIETEVDLDILFLPEQ